MNKEEFYKLIEKNLLTTYKDMVGKTIDAAEDIEDELLFKFSDGTFACLYGSGDYDQGHDVQMASSYGVNITPETALYLEIITESQYADLEAEKRAEYTRWRESERARRRELFEELKKEFGG